MRIFWRTVNLLYHNFHRLKFPAIITAPPSLRPSFPHDGRGWQWLTSHRSSIHDLILGNLLILRVHIGSCGRDTHVSSSLGTTPTGCKVTHAFPWSPSWWWQPPCAWFLSAPAGNRFCPPQCPANDTYTHRGTNTHTSLNGRQCFMLSATMAAFLIVTPINTNYLNKIKSPCTSLTRGK